ncbi:MAG: YfhO family protein [Acidimicrobiales bacterium]
MTSPDEGIGAPDADANDARPIKTGRWSFSRLGPLAVVVAPIVYSAIELRSQIRYVAYGNDSAFHSEMVRYATAQFRAGHFPLDGWFPYLNLGSPFFMHYQSLGAMIAGALGLAIGPNLAFSLCLYLLLVTWPLSVYLGARLFGFSRWTSAFAALASTFIVSPISVGFEQGAYLSIGYGVWSQLWAMWTLPLAWGFSWRAINDGRNYLWASLFIALTAAFHFETGYIAFLAIPLWVIVSFRDFRVRLTRAVVVAVGSLALSAWVIVPLLVYKDWTSVNEFLQHGPDVNSYGARRILAWLFTGKLFDHGRFPVFTLFAGAGFCACVARWRRDSRSRVLVVAFVVTLLLFFGRTTWGAAINLLPGSKELFLRRFVTGLDMSVILLVGVGAVAVGQVVRFAAFRLRGAYLEQWNSRPSRRLVARIMFAGLIIAVSTPMWVQLGHVDGFDARYIASQRSASVAESQVNRLVAKIKQIGGGRTYAGLLFTGWGTNFRVGNVETSEYLSVDQVDEIGFTNRASSLMSDPEAEFVDTNPADYALFGIRFVILPTTRRPPTGARLLERAGPYLLWFLSQNGYAQVVDTIGPPLIENRAHMGADSLTFLNSPLAGEGVYRVVSFGGRAAAAPTLAAGKRPAGPPGSVLSQHNDLQEGEFATTVHANRTAVVLLKVSYDPGWTVTVDGKRAKTELIAPAYVGVRVSKGTHVVKFRYQAFSYYPELFALAGIAVLVLCFGRRRLPRSLLRRA